MKRIIATIVLSGWSALAPAQPRPLGLFTYSRESVHGFQDGLLDTFRRELGKYAGSVVELAYERDAADVTVQFLGQGELAVELDATGSAVRHLWTPDEDAHHMWAIVRSDGFSKEFSVQGSGGRELSKLAKTISDWLVDNAARLREP